MPSPATMATEETLHWSLRFGDRLETLYRAEREQRAIPTRIALGVLALVMVALTPAYDLLTRPPPEFNLIARRIQFGLELPAVLLALGVLAAPRLRRHAPLALLLAATGMAGGLIAQRVIGLGYGFHVPNTFIAVVIAAMALLSGLRFWTLLGWSALVVAAGCGVEIWIDQASGRSIYESVTMGMLLSLLMAGAYALESTERRNWLDRRRLNDLACRDSLTGLFNRRHFDSVLERLLREAARERRTVALLLLDIDRFKSYNDLYGHPAGDECLRSVALWLEQSMRRPQDLCVRLGGEEFAAIWFNPVPPNARWLAEELRGGIGRLGIVHAGSGGAGVVTASGGLVELMPPAADQPVGALAAELMRRADRALYAAKADGRDCLRVAEPIST